MTKEAKFDYYRIREASNLSKYLRMHGFPSKMEAGNEEVDTCLTLSKDISISLPIHDRSLCLTQQLVDGTFVFSEYGTKEDVLKELKSLKKAGKLAEQDPAKE